MNLTPLKFPLKISSIFFVISAHFPPWEKNANSEQPCLRHLLSLLFKKWWGIKEIVCRRLVRAEFAILSLRDKMVQEVSLARYMEYNIIFHGDDRWGKWMDKWGHDGPNKSPWVSTKTQSRLGSIIDPLTKRLSQQSTYFL